MIECQSCGRAMRDHATLDLAKCMNPYCAEFDRPRIKHRATRVAPETPDAALARRPVPVADDPQSAAAE